MSSRMYFELAYSYGNEKAGIPIVDRTQGPNPNPIPRTANVMENYNYIVNDLKKQQSYYLPKQSFLPKITEDLIKQQHGRYWQRYTCL